jgi:hypothetical protein
VRAWQASILLTALFPTATTRAQCANELTPDRLHEALAWGLNAPETDLEQYPLRTERTWLINFDTPFLRVAQFSRAMKIQNTPATESDVSPKLAGQEVHVYAHARVASVGGPLPNIDYVVILRPHPGGASETILPTSVQSFVRRVPVDADSGPTRIARSVKAVFPLKALAVGNEVRLTFENGTFQTATITPEALTRVR